MQDYSAGPDLTDDFEGSSPEEERHEMRVMLLESSMWEAEVFGLEEQAESFKAALLRELALSRSQPPN